jgi:hypothetical protein
MQRDGRTDVTKVIGAFRNYANAPKMHELSHKLTWKENTELCPKTRWRECILLCKVRGSHSGHYEECCLLDTTPCSAVEMHRRFKETNRPPSPPGCISALAHARKWPPLLIYYCQLNTPLFHKINGIKICSFRRFIIFGPACFLFVIIIWYR